MQVNSVCARAACRGPHKDRIEIRRMGSSNVNVNITLEQEFMPPAFKLSQGLAEVCSCHLLVKVISRLKGAWALTGIYHAVVRAVAAHLPVPAVLDAAFWGLSTISGCQCLPSRHSLPPHACDGNCCMSCSCWVLPLAIKTACWLVCGPTSTSRSHRG